MKKILAAFMIAMLAGCTTPGPRIDKSLNATGQASRVRFLMLHYTVADKPASISS